MTFEILVTTDTHLGYKEKDKILGDDSFASFEEALDLANKFEVDIVLLGGDLFHEHRPSAQTYFKTSQIFNEHVFGDRPVKFETE
jgi:double-strand break repair protein MRE11